MHIRRATRSDLPDIATIAANAFWQDDLCQWLAPNQPKSELRQRCLMTNTRRFDNGLIMLLAITDEEDNDYDGKPKVIGYAAYEKEVGADDDSSKLANTWFGAFERLLRRAEENYIWYFRNNLGTIRARSRECNAQIAKHDASAYTKRFWELSFLVVEPAFGRRGIGGKLIDWGQERAAEDKVPLLLWSSKPGYPLYARKGFKEIGMLKFGDTLEAPWMAWEPGSSGVQR